MTVPMIHTEDGKTADVHPDEVENWRRFGWVIMGSTDAGTESMGGDGPSDTEMRAAIKAATGKAPGPRTSHDELVRQFNEIES